MKWTSEMIVVTNGYNFVASWLVDLSFPRTFLFMHHLILQFYNIGVI